jgi:hypothetical protein
LNNSRIKKIIPVIKQILLYIPATAVICWIAYLSLTPIIFRDELILHMSFPKIWAKNDFFFFHDFNLSTVGMMNLDYLYMLCFKYFGIEQMPKIIHASLLVFSSAAVFIFLKNRFGLRISYILTAVFILIPINQRLASEAYADLGVLFFSTLSLFWLIKWIESGMERLKWLIFSAVAAGLCTGTKYTGAIFTIASVFLVGYFYSKRKDKSKYAPGLMAIYSIIVFILISPWLIRTYNATKNPFYPLLNSVFKPDIITVESNIQPPPNEYAARKMMGESGLKILAIPFRMFLSGKDNDFIGGFDGKFNPFIFFSLVMLFFPFVWRPITDKSVVKALLFLFFLSFLFFLGYGHLRLRYFIYTLPMLIFLNGYIIDSFLRSHVVNKKAISVLIMSFFSLATGYNLSYSKDLFKKTGTWDYIFGHQTREEFLGSRSRDFRIAKEINKITPADSNIYIVWGGQRTYYFERNFSHDDNVLDRYFYNFFEKGAKVNDYLRHLENLPFKNMKKADFILIRPHDFLGSARKIFYNYTEEELEIKTSLFIKFLQSQNFLFEFEGTYLYELKYIDENNN